MSTSGGTEQRIVPGSTGASGVSVDALLPPYVARAVDPGELSDGQVAALQEVARRVQRRTSFDIDDTRDVATIARFISGAGRQRGAPAARRRRHPRRARRPGTSYGRSS